MTDIPGVVLTGTTAARPAASAVPPGTLYLSTSDGSFARSDGSTWSAIGEEAFSAWKDIRNIGHYAAAGSLASGTYLLAMNNAFLLNAASSGIAGYYIDPADYPGGSRTTKFRMRGEVITNAVAPAVNFTFGLYPVATWGGASGASPIAATLGTVVGATAAINAPGATSQNQVVTTPGTLTAGWYALTVATSGTSAANSNLLIHAALQVQQA